MNHSVYFYSCKTFFQVYCIYIHTTPTLPRIELIVETSKWNLNLLHFTLQHKPTCYIEFNLAKPYKTCNKLTIGHRQLSHSVLILQLRLWCKMKKITCTHYLEVCISSIQHKARQNHVPTLCDMVCLLFYWDNVLPFVKRNGYKRFACHNTYHFFIHGAFQWYVKWIKWIVIIPLYCVLKVLDILLNMGSFKWMANYLAFDDN